MKNGVAAALLACVSAVALAMAQPQAAGAGAQSTTAMCPEAPTSSGHQPCRGHYPWRADCIEVVVRYIQSLDAASSQRL